MTRAHQVLVVALLVAGAVVALLGLRGRAADPAEPAPPRAAAAPVAPPSPTPDLARSPDRTPPIAAPARPVPDAASERPVSTRAAVEPALPVVRAVPAQPAAAAPAGGCSLRVEVGPGATSSAVDLRRCWFAGPTLRTSGPIAPDRRIGGESGSRVFEFHGLEPGEHLADIGNGSPTWVSVGPGANRLRLDPRRPLSATLEFVEPLTGAPVEPRTVRVAFVAGLPFAADDPRFEALASLAALGPTYGPVGNELRVRGQVPLGFVRIEDAQPPLVARVDLGAGERIRVEVPQPLRFRFEPPAVGPRPTRAWAARLRLVAGGRRLAPEVEYSRRPYRLELRFEALVAEAGEWTLELDEGSRPPFAIPRVPLAPGAPLTLGR